MGGAFRGNSIGRVLVMSFGRWRNEGLQTLSQQDGLRGSVRLPRSRSMLFKMALAVTRITNLNPVGSAIQANGQDPGIRSVS